MRTLRQAAALAMAGALAGVPAVAQEIHPGEQRGLGLTGPDIPDVLKAVAADPYKQPADPPCETIPAEIKALDHVLGADAGQDQPKKSYIASFAARQASGAIRGMVPYRGVIRFLTGADHKDKELMAAAQAGWARRGFLRGLEANMHCAPQTQVAAAVLPPPGVADGLRRLETTYTPEAAPAAAPEPAQSPADGGGQGATGQSPVDLGEVMLAGPRDEGFDKPGR